jgi:CRP/FNR family transcriptional regulator
MMMATALTSPGRTSVRESFQNRGTCAITSIAFATTRIETPADLFAARGDTLTLSHHEPVFQETERSTHVYRVVSGMVRLHKGLSDGRRQIIGFLQAGDYLGLAVGTTHGCSADVIEGAVLLRLRRSEVAREIEDNHYLSRHLMNLVASEVNTAQEHMLLLGRKTATEKVCTFLLGLSDRRRRRGLSPNQLKLPMTRTDIGDHVGLTVETVSRTFSHLRSRKLIETRGSDWVYLLDIESMRTCALAQTIVA